MDTGDIDDAGRATLESAASAYFDADTSPPPGLVDSVMRTVAADLRPGHALPIPASSGRAFVADRAVANALRVVLDADPAVVAGRVSVRVSGDPTPDRPVPPVDVGVSAAVSYDRYSRGYEQDVRDRIATAARRMFGLEVDRVDLEIVDVFLERGAQ